MTLEDLQFINNDTEGLKQNSASAHRKVDVPKKLNLDLDLDQTISEGAKRSHGNAAITHKRMLLQLLKKEKERKKLSHAARHKQLLDKASQTTAAAAAPPVSTQANQRSETGVSLPLTPPQSPTSPTFLPCSQPSRVTPPDSLNVVLDSPPNSPHEIESQKNLAFTGHKHYAIPNSP